MVRVVTFGELMLRLAPNGYNRFFQGMSFIVYLNWDSYFTSYCGFLLLSFISTEVLAASNILSCLPIFLSLRLLIPKISFIF